MGFFDLFKRKKTEEPKVETVKSVESVSESTPEVHNEEPAQTEEYVVTTTEDIVVESVEPTPAPESTPEIEEYEDEEVNVEEERKELAEGLEKTKEGFFGRLKRAIAGRSTVDADVLDDLEEVLITSDVGVETTVKIINAIEARVAKDKYMNTSELHSILRDEIAKLMEESHLSLIHISEPTRP